MLDFHALARALMKAAKQKHADRSHAVGERLGVYITVARVVMC